MIMPGAEQLWNSKAPVQQVLDKRSASGSRATTSASMCTVLLGTRITQPHPHAMPICQGSVAPHHAGAPHAGHPTLEQHELSGMVGAGYDQHA